MVFSQYAGQSSQYVVKERSWMYRVAQRLLSALAPDSDAEQHERSPIAL